MTNPIKQIDPNMELELPYRENQKGKTNVYKVKDKTTGANSTIKTAPLADPKANAWLSREQRALTLIRDENLPVVNRLIDTYNQTKGVKAIRKEWFDGEPLNKYGKVQDPELKEELRYTIERLHDKGIANLDLDAQNVMVSKDWEKIKLIELDTAEFKDDCGNAEFEEHKKEDWNQFNKLFY